jgi:hypothetical protein
MPVSEQETSNAQNGEHKTRNTALMAAAAAAATGAASYAAKKKFSHDEDEGSDSEEGAQSSSQDREQQGGQDRQSKLVQGLESTLGKGKEKAKAKVKGRKSGGSQSLISSAAAGGWDAAREAILPLAEDVAGAAGSYLADHAPEIVRDRIVPRFIEAFNEGR